MPTTTFFSFSFFNVISLEHFQFTNTCINVLVNAYFCRYRASTALFFFAFSKLVKYYNVKPDPAGTTVTPITRTLLCPAKPINLQFVDRISKPKLKAAAAGGGVSY